MAAVEAFIHETIAPRILGKDPLAITAIHESLLQDFMGFAGSSVAVRGASNIDRNRKAQIGMPTGVDFGDLIGFINSPDELVSRLKSMGMTAMKIWLFDEAAMRSGGL